MITALLLLSAPAQAIDLKWWGVGPTIGTMAIPNEYPLSLPANAFAEEDVDSENPLVEKVKADVGLGLHAVAYPSANGRLGFRGTLGFGTNGWNRQEFTIEYEPAIVREQDFQLLLGGGIGAGAERFPADNGGSLRVNYFPLRAQLTTMLRDKSRAYEIGLFGTFHIVADQNFYDSKDDADPISGAEAANDFLGADGIAGGSYLAIGAEATIYFGDFRGKQDNDDGGGGKGGKGGGGKGGKGGDGKGKGKKGNR